MTSLNLSEFRLVFFCCMIEGCTRKYTTKFNLKKHVEFNHLKKIKFSCQDCRKTFVSKLNLKEHLYVHSGEMPYECDLCGEKFRQISRLSLHKRHHKMQGGSLGCCLLPQDLVETKKNEFFPLSRD
jgi:hypothetical protein